MEHDEKHDATSQPLDEPQTPMWLPVLGGALFLVAGIYWATRPVYHAPPPPEPVASAPAASASAAPIASAPMNRPAAGGIASAMPMPSAMRGRFR